MYDAIVVGARCAGSPTAMLLARKGYRVLLLDKASFPSDTLSVHYIHQPGVASLARWGLLDKVIASNCPPVRRQRLDLGPFALDGAATPVEGIAEGYAPRRTILDQILVEAAGAAGAEVRERFSVQELVVDDERVTGIRGRAAGGEIVTEEARIVIGADGLRSLVARGVQAPAYNVTPALTCAYYSYWSDAPMEEAELYPRPGQMIIAAPTNDGQTLVIIYWPRASFHEVRADIEGHFLKALESAPALAARLRGGKRSERFRGTADLPNQFRVPHGPGWALVGDAGYHKDPILAQGISDAFRDAELLAGAVDAGLSGRESLADALSGYQQRRDQHVGPMFATTIQFARMEMPPPEIWDSSAPCAGIRSRRTACSAPSRGRCRSRSSSRRRTSGGLWAHTCRRLRYRASHAEIPPDGVGYPVISAYVKHPIVASVATGIEFSVTPESRSEPMHKEAIMYGTVARLQIKSGMQEAFMALGRDVAAQGIPGWIGEYMYRSDANPDEFFMAVVFESKEAYRKNAESPASAATFERMRALLVADPEWHDGEVVYTYP